ncbi:hypothetical protein BE221DRAFT_160208 [Ostreococcus tauri]|uniref:WLM domain-containing protein n=1 Tax=Ostreococcus tauri TaxID=70448 RepID=A0A1Y5I8K6_OSTTA|nr:hypothetical protein BE221DRAFT_160208 [Ostreococcus tauri]
MMKRRGWRVDALTELPPSTTTLWGDNANRGERVRLLLAHNEIDAHDGRFYALLETLKTEAAVNMASDFIVCGRGKENRPLTAVTAAAATAKADARRKPAFAPGDVVVLD